eukprot:snap_masked-scaffold_8-processed-gene-7.25-mRNA-1 protein AED:1.00 eAED:1.00 QI:0/-1/0/0/-1/1/1/0/254
MLTFLVASALSFVFIRKRHRKSLENNLESLLPKHLQKNLPFTSTFTFPVSRKSSLQDLSKETLSDFRRNVDNILYNLSTKDRSYTFTLRQCFERESKLLSEYTVADIDDMFLTVLAEVGMLDSIKEHEMNFFKVIISSFFSVSSFIGILIQNQLPMSYVNPSYSINYSEAGGGKRFDLVAKGFVGLPVLGDGGPDSKFAPGKMIVKVEDFLSQFQEEYDQSKTEIQVEAKVLIDVTNPRKDIVKRKKFRSFPLD